MLVGIGLAAWCGWVSGFHRTTAAAEVTWVCSLVAVVLVDVALWRGATAAKGGGRPPPVTEPWPRRGCGGGRRALRGVSAWLVLIVVAVAWDVLGIDSGPHQYHLTLSALAQAYRPLSAAVLLVWMLVGVGYEAARLRVPRRPFSPGAIEDAGPVSPERTDGGTSDGGTTAWGGVVVLGLAGPHATPALLLPQSPSVGVAFWVAVAVAAIVIDQVARRSRGRLATAEEFTRFTSTAPWANLALIAAWTLAGYHLFAR